MTNQDSHIFVCHEVTVDGKARYDSACGLVQRLGLIAPNGHLHRSLEDDEADDVTCPACRTYLGLFRQKMIARSEPWVHGWRWQTSRTDSRRIRLCSGHTMPNHLVVNAVFYWADQAPQPAITCPACRTVAAMLGFPRKP